VERTEAEGLDREDPLAEFRELFVTDDSLIYMDGNSLGRLPKATIEAVQTLLEAEWGSELVGAWHNWIELSEKIGDRIAQSFLNAGDSEVIVADSTSVNLYKLASSALDARSSRKRILTSADNFPSDLYILQGLCAQRDVELETEGSLDSEVALVCLSHVNYMSGEVADMARITREAHEAGALALWDLSHSVGAIPIDLKGSNVDLAVGSTYKYLNGGPGAPAFLFVRRDLQDELRQPIWGWFGQKDQFAMKPNYEPADGISKFLTGTPPVVSLKGVEIGIEFLAEAGIERLREKSTRLTDLMISLFDEWLEPLGLKLASPRDLSQRGAHVAFRHPEAWRICRALIENHRVIPDFREPDLIRYGPAPIYTRFVEAWDSMDLLRQVVEEHSFEEFSQERLRVT
jgi:kynureninase